MKQREETYPHLPQSFPYWGTFTNSANTLTILFNPFLSNMVSLCCFTLAASQLLLYHLQMLRAVIKETLRLYPPIPLLVPQESTQDVKINEYDIATGTQVITNAWAIHRDAATWEEPEESRPERFLISLIDFKGHAFEFIPFGSGRRGCPGILFAIANNELVLANIVDKFNWSLPQLHYLKAVIKEIFSLHPPVPVLVPRESIKDVTIEGYDIPAKTRIFINVWAIGRDPESWKDPETFNPDRFLGNTIDFKGQDFELLPFGAGRRGCPGITFGTKIVELALAQLLHSFDWKLPPGVEAKELDLSETFGISMHKTSDLIVVAKQQLS